MAPTLERTYALVERAVGRKLRAAEKAIDVLLLQGALERAKNELDAAIGVELVRAVKAWAATPGSALRPRLEITPAIWRPLEELHELGRSEALNELERAGYRARRMAAPDPMPGGDFEDLEGTMRLGLDRIALRVADDFVAADLSGASTNAIAQAMLAVPGARDLASRVVSTALYSGMALTFEEAGDLVAGFEYSSVLDHGTCDQCAPLDGTTYPSWDAIQGVLPGGGPNPECRGGGRCRCRAVPLPA